MASLPFLLLIVGLVSVFLGFNSVVTEPIPKRTFFWLILPIGLVFTLCGILLFFVPHFFGF
jgi:hypothetical protein